MNKPKPSELPIYTIIRPENERLYIRKTVETWEDLETDTPISQDLADVIFEYYAIVAIPAFYDKRLRKRRSHDIRMRLTVNKT